MGELYNPFPKLPKNIRQIGERDQVVKLYVEDYVNTYLKRLYPIGGQDLRVGLLLGSMEMNDGMPYLFIDGAMEMEDVTESGQKVAFSELAWKKAYQNTEQLFPKRTILGWFLCGAPGSDLSPLNYWKQHIQYFPGPNQLMYLNFGAENEETVYITAEDGFYKLGGYNIYYERNQMMQDYMVLRKDVKRVESKTDDKVTLEFRKRMVQRKEEATGRRDTVGLMGGLSTAMAIVILAGGIVLFNNYEKMQQMESVIVSAIPEKTENLLMGKIDGTDLNSKIVVEEADGGVYPTTEAVQEESRQTMSETTEAPTEAPETPKAAAEAAAEATTEASKKEPSVMASAAMKTHRVQDGETLYGICLAEYHNLKKLAQVCEVNGLEDEDKIVSGQELLLP